ncbi:MAG: transcriptional regulator [marine bacterium B5-7]|nr:MAG: transcriptional regulator [marine bacterium B5-7]
MLAIDPRTLAIFIKDARQRQDLSQADLADRVGLKQATISAFENNPDGTKLETLYRILSARNLQLDLLDRTAFQYDNTWLSSNKARGKLSRSQPS